MRYVYHTSVISVFEKIETTSGRKVGDDIVMKKESRGWFIRLTDSSAIWLGHTKPDIEVGDRIRITMEKV